MRGSFKLSFLAIFLLLVVAGRADAKSPPPGSGAADVPANVLILLDTSNSMDNKLHIAGNLQYHQDVAFDSDNNVYVASYYDYIEKYEPDGTWVANATWGGTGTGNGQYGYIFAIAIDSSDNLYVSDSSNARIQKLDTDGNYVSQFSVAGGASYGIDVDSSGNIYVCNGSGAIGKYNSSGTLLATWATTNARYIAIDEANNKVYVSRPGSTRVTVLNFTTGAAISNNNLGFVPAGIEVDSSGNVYVGTLPTDTVKKYNSSFVLQATYGGTGTSLGQFRNPKGLEKRASDGLIYAADFNNYRVQTVTGTLLVPKDEKTRIEAAQDVIKAIVSDSDLTNGANFGLITWNETATLQVEVSTTGASEISALMDTTLPLHNHTYLDSGLTLAQSYLTGVDSPIDSDASCQQTILIVVSDGQWQDDPDETAEDIYNALDVKTYAVGFTTIADTSGYISVSQAGGTYPDSPLFTDDESGLLDSLSTFIRSAIETQFTFTVPTIIPGITNEDHILQSTFLYKQEHQWKGHLYKYELDADGLIGDEIWDAGERLNLVSSADRNIWTAENSLDFSLNNFNDTELDALRPALSDNASVALVDDTLTDIINYVRGEDVYSEFTSGEDDDGDTIYAGDRWKLGDIYHSKAVVVGPPSAYFSDSVSENSESYYRAVNGYAAFKTSNTCGGACSSRDEVIYVGSNAGMLHAFDSETGDEKWAFIPPPVLPELRGVISAQANESVAINGVDGSPAVKDIYYGGDWRTVLIGGLRQGGPGYYALDITDPDNPAHLFSFAYNKINDEINYWSASGARTDYDPSTVTDEYDFSLIGESWSDPIILKTVIDGDDKWVSVFGGGYNNNTTGDYGSAVYVIDLEDGGKVLQKIVIPDSNASNGIYSSVVPRLTAITADTTTTFNHKGAFVYFTDMDGSLWKINLSDSGTLYETTRIFDVEATLDNDRLCFHQLAPTILSNGKLMNFFGTADLGRIGRVSSDIANRAFGIFDTEYPNFVEVVEPYTAADLADVTNDFTICPTGDQQGWYLDLDANEKVTAAAAVRGGNVIFSRYTPNSSDICEAGTSIISEHEFACGGTMNEVNLGSGMATEAVVYKDKVYIGISSDSPDAGSLPAGFVKQGNLIIGTPVVDPDTSVRIEYWKEDF